ncbi:hypothetical protein A2U01_0069022, partial [Trifolium medium]|nr:hypothetical protein [Trifolium medium]
VNPDQVPRALRSTTLRVAPTPEENNQKTELHCALRKTSCALRQRQKVKLPLHKCTARCAKNRKLNRPHSLNCVLRHMHLRVAPYTEHEGIVAV